MKYRLYIERADDRDIVITALARNGYAVRQGKEKSGSKYVHFIEYWRPEAA